MIKGKLLEHAEYSDSTRCLHQRLTDYIKAPGVSYGHEDAS